MVAECFISPLKSLEYTLFFGMVHVFCCSVLSLCVFPFVNLSARNM